jgi:hypothetical protein
MAIAPKKSTNKSLDNLSLLTQWLINDKNTNIDPILKDTNVASYKYRIISYLLKYPRIINYVNTYLNDLYAFDNSKYTLKEWLDSFKYIFKMNNLRSLSNVYFAKFKPAKRVFFKSELQEYVSTVYNKVLSENDLNELYRLHSLKIISDEHLEEIKLINSGKDIKTGKLPVLTKPTAEPVEFKEVVVNFNTSLTNYITYRLPCKNCALYNSPKHPIVSNLENKSDPLDIMIVGEFPTGANFLDDHKALKSLIEIYELKYVATNLVLCEPSGLEIPNASKTIANCKEVTNHIHKGFSPNIKILIGAAVKKQFNIHAPMSKIVGELINNCIVIDTPDHVKSYKTGLVKLNDFLAKYSKDKINRINIEQNSVENSVINQNIDLKNYTLFDIKLIHEQILYVLIENKTGNKKYISETVSFPVFIKKGTFRQCEYLTDDSDFVVYLSNQQKMQLNQILKKQLQKELII